MKTIIRTALLFGSLWLVACNESPSTAFGDLIDDKAAEEAEYDNAEARSCRNAGGTWDSWYGCRYSSSSYSSGNNATNCQLTGGTWDYYYDYCDYNYRSSSSYYRSSSSYYSANYYYTTTQKTMRITTISYRQTSYDWDVFDNAGDPEISYMVYFTKKDGTTATSYTSSHFLGTDTRSYATEFRDDVTVPVNTIGFYIYPSVVDRDVSSNDDKSSGYGFGWSDVGYTKAGQLHTATDDKGGYSLSFNWQFL